MSSQRRPSLAKPSCLTGGIISHTLPDIVPTDSQPPFPLASGLTPSEPVVGPACPGVPEPIDPDNPRWGLGGASLVWVASIILLFVIPSSFLILYALGRGLNPRSPEYLDRLTVLAATDVPAIILQTFALAPAHLVTFALVWALVTRFGQRPFMASVGLGWSGWRSVLVAVGLGVELFVLGIGFTKLMGLDQGAIFEEIINSPRARILIFIPGVLTAPVVEEFIYRGVLYPALQRLVGVVGAVLLVVVLFTIIHLPRHWFDLRGLAVLGVISISLTLIRAYTGQLLPCILLHFVYNGILFTIFLVAPQLARVGPSSEQAAYAVLLLANPRLSMFGL